MCKVCDKLCDSGYHCSYCDYNLCIPCSVIYDENGHTLKIWTHAESQYHCRVCGRQPITSGYHCTECPDYNICDLCTAIPGRKFIQQVILDKMKEYLKYMENHQDESETAKKTITTHKKKMATNAYPTTLALYEFSQSLYGLKEIAVAEVRQTRITKEVLRLRALIVGDGTKYCATALRESQRDGHFTAEEITRLNVIVDWDEREKSMAVRSMQKVGCVHGHACYYHQGRPPAYVRRDASTPLSEKAKGKNLARCKICDRVCATEVYHCEYCEYDMCPTCSVIYCSEGHPMGMWIVPEAMDAYCNVCGKQHLTSGYHCKICDCNTCDRCTTREARGGIRDVWTAEMKGLLAFMNANKRLSGIAHYYHWRHNTYIVSIGLLTDYVRELRMAKEAAERQVIQKPIIDKIKEFRAEIVKDVKLSATAVREAAKPEHYIFFTTKKAAQEATRLQGILKQSYLLQSTEKRLAAGIACPLGHALSHIDSQTQLQSFPPLPPPEAILRATPSNKEQRKQDADEAKMKLTGASSVSDVSHKSAMTGQYQYDEMASKEEQSGADSGGGSSSMLLQIASYQQAFSQPVSSVGESKAAGGDDGDAASSNALTGRFSEGTGDGDGEENSVVVSSLPDHDTELESVFASEAEEWQKNLTQAPRMCRVCAAKDLSNGHFCPLCEYDLCCDCSTIYCRMGHPLKIWTFPEAMTLQCDMCKRCSITSGYRCTVCDIDVCDLCTTRDCRNAYMLWPRRELKRLFTYFESIVGESQIAAGYVAEQQATLANYMESMSLLCKKLSEARAIKEHVEEELRLRKVKLQAKKYGLKGVDL